MPWFLFLGAEYLSYLSCFLCCLSIYISVSDLVLHQDIMSQYIIIIEFMCTTVN